MTFAAPVPMGAASGPAPGFAPPPKKPFPVAAIVGIVAAVGCLPVIAIVAAILFPVFAKVRDRARETSSMSNLRMLGLATMQFAQDHDQKLPPTDSMDHFKSSVGTYLTPQNKYDPFVETGANVPYALNGRISAKSLERFPHPEVIVLARETVPHSDGKIAVLYLDGHVTLEPAVDTDRSP
jgi:prepilin-type processing-associated H-X9-DG protein